MKIKILFVIKISMLFYIVGLSPMTFAEKNLSICIDENPWIPFTFVFSGKPSGIHVELISHASMNLGYTVTIHPLPWKRCLQLNQTGAMDAVLSLSYKEDRTHYLYYPQDVSKTKPRWRVTMAEYVVVSKINSQFGWNGDDLSLPQPVGIPMGYGTAERLRAKNIEVAETPGEINLLAMLKRGRVEVALAYRNTVEYLIKEPEFAGEFKIHPKPYKTKPYYLGVSKKGKVTYSEAQIIWEEVAKTRDNPLMMEPIVKKISKAIEGCHQNKSLCGFNL